MSLEVCVSTRMFVFAKHVYICLCKGASLCMFLFAGRYTHILVAVALLYCTKTGPINQINLRDWMKVKGWMKGEGTEIMTAVREREDETGKENDRQLCGTAKRPERKRETEKEEK